MKILTREDIYGDFSYYGSESYRKYMTGKALFQYERTKTMHGAKVAYDEYVTCHIRSLWEDLFGRDLTPEEMGQA